MRSTKIAMTKHTAISNKSTVISVDWDYFIPEKISWDLEHKESLLYLKMLWMHRMYLKDEMKVNGLLRGFWDRLPVKGHPLLFVSDSHAYVHQVLQIFKPDRVVLFDAHHDCWKKTNSNIYCHDWGTHFRDSGGEILWVHPDDEQHRDLVAYSTPPSLEHQTPETSLVLGSVDAVHICRSGCWTPPWLDKRFISFVKRAEKRLRAKAHVLQNDEWNPMKERFTADDFRQAEELQRQVESFRSKPTAATARA